MLDPRLPRSFGPYTLVQRLAQGGMAEVFLARRHPGPGGSNLVIKRILPHLSEDPEFVAMFTEEARLAVRLDHPNIVQMYDFGQEGQTWYIALEYVDGPSLHSLIRQSSGAIPKAIAVRIACGIAAGLAYAHALVDEATGEPLGLVHRDVSPPNILVARDGSVKLVDFGIAKAIHTKRETHSTSLKGKFAYMAPEQFDGVVTQRVDLYALGVCLYEMLSGAPLFRHRTVADLIRAVCTSDIEPLRARAPWVPEALEAIVMRAIHKDPDQRYASAETMQLVLERFLTQNALSASPETIGTYVADVLANPAPRKPAPPEDEVVPDGERGESDHVTSVKREKADPSGRPTVEVGDAPRGSFAEGPDTKPQAFIVLSTRPVTEPPPEPRTPTLSAGSPVRPPAPVKPTASPRTPAPAERSAVRPAAAERPATRAKADDAERTFPEIDTLPGQNGPLAAAAARLAGASPKPAGGEVPEPATPARSVPYDDARTPVVPGAGAVMDDARTDPAEPRAASAPRGPDEKTVAAGEVSPRVAPMTSRPDATDPAPPPATMGSPLRKQEPLPARSPLRALLEGSKGRAEPAPLADRITKPAAPPTEPAPMPAITTPMPRVPLPAPPPIFSGGLPRTEELPPGAQSSVAGLRPDGAASGTAREEGVASEDRPTPPPKQRAPAATATPSEDTSGLATIVRVSTASDSLTDVASSPGLAAALRTAAAPAASFSTAAAALPSEDTSVPTIVVAEGLGATQVFSPTPGLATLAAIAAPGAPATSTVPEPDAAKPATITDPGVVPSPIVEARRSRLPLLAISFLLVGSALAAGLYYATRRPAAPETGSTSTAQSVPAPTEGSAPVSPITATPSLPSPIIVAPAAPSTAATATVATATVATATVATATSPAAVASATDPTGPSPQAFALPQPLAPPPPPPPPPVTAAQAERAAVPEAPLAPPPSAAPGAVADATARRVPAPASTGVRRPSAGLTAPRLPSAPRETRPPQATRETARLFVNTEPWSHVLVGGRDVGTTPVANIEVPSGRVSLTLIDPEGQRFRKSVRLAPGEQKRVFFQLQ